MVTAPLAGSIYKINARELRDAIGVPSEDSLLITTSIQGIQVGGTYRGEEFNYVDPVETEYDVDPIGAGDVFLARFTHSLIHHNDIRSAVTTAKEFAAASVKHKGCYFPKDLLKKDKTNDQGRPRKG